MSKVEQGPIGPQGPQGELSKGQKVGLLGVAGLIGLGGLWGLKGNNNEQNVPLTSSTTSTSEAFIPTTTLPALDEQSTTTIVTEAPFANDSESTLNDPYANSAEGENGLFTLLNSDNGENQIDLSQAIGFTPDADLRVSDISPNELDPIPADAADFQAYLNSERDGFTPLAGFTDGTNDYNQYYNNESAPQLPAYGWMVHTGLFVEIPGIGRVEGGDSRAAVVIILNRTDDVYRWDTNSVKVIAGFQGWGRIWNGEADAVQETEERLTNHYRERLGKGVPETGFIGQCDEGAENCNSVTVVTVERVQWGENEDGSPRYQFRLIRAETIPTSSN